MTSEKLGQKFQGRFQDAAYLVPDLENILLSKIITLRKGIFVVWAVPQAAAYSWAQSLTPCM